jgi:signal recognition particle receptor subunit beta
MVVVSYSGREINAKIVYYGPGLSGKTTNLEKIYDSVPETNRGRMVSMKTQTDRTLFFDLLPLDLGELQGMKTRFLLYTVPGQVYYNATRKLVLKGVDALVFVADSSPDKLAENRESLSNLEQNLKAYGLDLKTVPWVLQFNKRDTPNAMPVSQMNQELNRHDVPTFEAQAANGQGVFETLRGVSKLLLARISKDVIDRDRGSLVAPSRVSSEEPTLGKTAAGEAPTPSIPSGSGRGKLMQFLKRAPGEQPESAPKHSAPASSAAAAPSVPAGPFTPPASMQPDETVLTSEDLIPIRDAEPAISRRDDPEPAIVRRDDPEPAFSAGEIEREASYGGRSSVSFDSSSGETRQITVPIELGSLPASGRLRLVFEVRLEVEPASPKPAKRSASRGGAMMRDLETIPD